MNFIISILGKIPVFLLLFLSALSVTTGDFFAKYWSTNQKIIFYVLAFVGYLGSSFFYIPTLLRKGLVVTSVTWSILSIVGFLFIGLIIFKEHLSPLEILGVILGIVSLVILNLK